MSITVVLNKIKATLWLQALIIAVVILFGSVVADYFFTKEAYKKQNQRKHEPVAIDKAKAIQKAQDYLLATFDQIDPQQRLILDYLQRTYNLDTEFDGDVKQITAKPGNADLQKEFETLQRIAYPSRLTNTLGQSPSLVSLAANCDHIALTPNFTDQLTNEIGEGSYFLTHVALSLKIAQELGCHISGEDTLPDQLRDGMVKIIQAQDTPADLRYESITFLQLLGFKNDVNSAWIDQVASEQQANGSWLPGNGSPMPVDHSTVLALWALLAYQHPEAKQVLIRH